MTTNSPESISRTLGNCWICGGQALTPSHEERFDLGASAYDEDHREMLGLNCQMPRSAS